MQKNIIWITLDSVRADHTTMGGYHRDTTPNLQRIANLPDGESFSTCIATGRGTPTSSASILTGTYPSRHGFTITNDFVPEQLASAPELLAEEGYFTAGLSRNSYLSSGSGLDRGFDQFKWIGGSNLFTAVHPISVIKYLLNIRRHSGGVTTDTEKHATPYLMNDVLKRWLKDFHSKQPFFLYAHYNEPHRPYYPPLPYLDRYTGDLNVTGKEAAQFALDVHHRVPEIIANGYTLTDREERILEAMYDAEIAYTDDRIGALFDCIQEQSFDDTVFVVTSDHGEFFGEHGLLGHTLRLDDAVTHVPLVTHGLDEISHQRDELIQHIDLMQTLISDAGGQTSQFQGINLRETTRAFTISQRDEGGLDQYLAINPEFDTSRFHQSTTTALRTTDFKYQKSVDRSELFELPDETNDVSEKYPEIVTELDNRLEQWLNEDGQPIKEERSDEFSPAMKKQLRELGYLE